MVNYSDIDLARIEAAHERYNDFILENGLSEKVRDNQWGKVARKEADMDAAFVMAVEEAKI